jgi:FixJ family two-component response regulator
MLESSYSQLINSVQFARRQREASERVSHLSAREADILSGLLAGASHKLIARHFGISDRTVEMYRNNMVRKLGAKSTNEAIHLGILARVKPAELRKAS